MVHAIVDVKGLGIGVGDRDVAGTEECTGLLLGGVIDVLAVVCSEDVTIDDIEEVVFGFLLGFSCLGTRDIWLEVGEVNDVRLVGRCLIHGCWVLQVLIRLVFWLWLSVLIVLLGLLLPLLSRVQLFPPYITSCSSYLLVDSKTWTNPSIVQAQDEMDDDHVEDTQEVHQGRVLEQGLVPQCFLLDKRWLFKLWLLFLFLIVV